MPAPGPPHPPHPLTQRTIVCEGWVSVSASGNSEYRENAPATTTSNNDTDAARARPSVKRKPSLRRRSLDALRGAVLGVFGGGGGDKDTKAAVEVGRRGAERSVKAWLDDAAVLYLDGWAVGGEDGGGGGRRGADELPQGRGGLGEDAELMVPASVMDLRDAYSGIRAKKKKKKSKALDIWDRRAWDADAGLASEISLPSTASQTSLFCVSAAAPTRAPLLTPFRVLASSLDPAASAILLTVDPLPTISTATSQPSSSPSQSSPLSQRRPQPPPKHDHGYHHHNQQRQHQLRMHFTSTRKLARWSAALSLALCVSHATRHARLQAVRQQRRRSDGAGLRYNDNHASDDDDSRDQQQEVEEDIVHRCEKAEWAARAAQRETRRAVRRVRSERTERAQRVAEMLSVEEVQDVYQQTANALAAAQNRITHLTQLIAQERAEQDRATTSLAALRAQRDPLRAAAVHSALQMRHEDLCRRYKELRREAAMGKVMWEREREAHVKLAEWVRSLAVEGVDGGNTGGGDGDGIGVLEDERLARKVLALESGSGDEGGRSSALSSSPSSSSSPSLSTARRLSIQPTTQPGTQPPNDDAGGIQHHNANVFREEEESASCNLEGPSTTAEPKTAAQNTAPSGRAMAAALLSPRPSPPSPPSTCAPELLNARGSPTDSSSPSRVIWCKYEETPPLSPLSHVDR
ncbi:hypothetical protein HDU87_005784 [Geranomyces variabilis]|uniref:Uncharacterized protein n=1 Tax=Geranomyces variabilis TaxID=109894 RepID=A0AAD5XPF5_9FUNG|nr:hypothetical protein HDU87_005784 [Geranomyces variabilis]